MRKIPLADVAAIKSVVDFLRESGVSPDHQLDRLNMSRELIEKGEGKITKAQVYRFLNRIERCEGLIDLGFRLGDGYFPFRMGGIGRAVLQAATLQDAIQTLDNLLHRFMGENRVWLQQEGDKIWLCNAADDGFQLQRPASTQCTIIVFIELIRLAAGPDWLPRYVKLEMEPSDSHGNVEALSDTTVSFHHEITAVEFPIELLGQPIRHSLQGLLSAPIPPENPEGFLSSLNKLLRDQIDYGLVPSLVTTSGALGISPRSLQRHLRDHGLTFRRLMDRTRFEMAQDLLKDPTAKIRDVGMSLGYSSHNNFIRAFRRISGMRPTEFRNMVLQGDDLA
jgi:AraC-like DNA-binding protein